MPTTMNPFHRRRAAATVEPPPVSTTRQERLLRWAEVLDCDPDRICALVPLMGASAVERATMMVENSPLSIAHADSILRIWGLRSERVQDAIAFFELSEMDAARIFGLKRTVRSRTARDVAHRVRNVADKRSERMIFRLALTGGVAGVLLIAMVSWFVR
ncbi:hypothetical protein E2493_02875 [Sphingomonas parva]|uniref:Uncharacterized protein n=1 Tax=Sphingomonas parva TaxID=2555898 RepID=A0A4Y8ZYR6_9SPHN|nr:hypothetical protein [Sphingomonas parva]TFI59796.1 hypothetical protein E2493_02875 [Sphingomonas parva]